MLYFTGRLHVLVLIKDNVKLPSYFHCRNSLSSERVKIKLTKDMFDFILYDMEEFISSFNIKAGKTMEDAMEK